MIFKKKTEQQSTEKQQLERQSVKPILKTKVNIEKKAIQATPSYFLFQYCFSADTCLKVCSRSFTYLSPSCHFHSSCILLFETIKQKLKKEELTGIENSSAKYFNSDAPLAKKLLLSARLPWSFVSNSFLTTEATESIIMSLIFFEIISSSKDLILRKKIKNKKIKPSITLFIQYNCLIILELFKSKVFFNNLKSTVLSPS